MLPSLAFSGGSGGDAQTGATTNSVPVSVSFGGFSVGGKGNTAAGGTSAAGTLPWWAWLVMGGAAFLVLLIVLKKR